MKTNLRNWQISLVLVILICGIVCSAFQNRPGITLPNPDSKKQSAIDSLRSIATGFEAYKVDFNCYPQNLFQLTSPIAYLTRIPAEPYGGKWNIVSSKDSIYLSIQSDIHPEYKRSFVNEDKLRSLSEEKLLAIILSSEHQDIRHAAWQILSAKKDFSQKKVYVKYFIKLALSSPDTTMQINALEAVGIISYYYSSPQDYRALLGKLKDSEQNIRIAAIHSLTPYIGLPEDFKNTIIELCQMVTNDPSPNVRSESAIALGTYPLNTSNRNAVLYSLVTSLYDTDARVRTAAASSLDKFKGYISDSSPVIDRLIEIAKQDAPQTQVAAMNTLGILYAKQAIPVLLTHLISPNPDVKETAISALCRIGEPEAVAPMQHLLGSEFDSIRVPLIQGLGRLASPKATAIIAQWLHDSDPKIRATVVTTLGKINISQTKPILLTALQDKNPEIRVDAAISLNQITPNLSERTHLQKLSMSDKLLMIKQEMKMMMNGLESYYIDSSSYPLVQHYPRTLTTPVAYIAYLPADPFSKQPIHLFRYNTPLGNPYSWILISDGPDQFPDINVSQLKYNSSDMNILIPLSYDPTNGVASRGDVWQSNY